MRELRSEVIHHRFVWWCSGINDSTDHALPVLEKPLDSSRIHTGILVNHHDVRGGRWATPGGLYQGIASHVNEWELAGYDPGDVDVVLRVEQHLGEPRLKHARAGAVCRHPDYNPGFVH